MSRYTEQILEELDVKLDEVEELIRRLPLKSAVQDQIVNQIYDMWSEIEDNLDMTPVDFED